MWRHRLFSPVACCFVVFVVVALSIWSFQSERAVVEYQISIDPNRPLAYARPINTRRTRPPHVHDKSCQAKSRAEAALLEATKLKDTKVRFKIIVFAWKRQASLERLMVSLVRANYLGFTVDLDIQIEHGPSVAVIDYIYDYKWPHGNKKITMHSSPMGLEAMVMNSWKPRSDDEFAFFFEDDIEVSLYYFEYTIVALSKYVFPKTAKAELPPHYQQLIGFSLITPRFNEVLIPHAPWTPDKAIEGTDLQFLFQLPSSWGALYFPWSWREFLEFYDWRQDHLSDHLSASIPQSYTKFWKRSWKKYLIEYMFMNGLVMTYPAFPHQVSYSTHLREQGEHTAKDGGQAVAKDTLGIHFFYFFTVPLLQDNEVDYHHSLIGEMKPLEELPLVSYYHERVADLSVLKQLGLSTWRLMAEAGYNSTDSVSNCILDRVAPLRTVHHPQDGFRYLSYTPWGSVRHQLEMFCDATLYTMKLGRILAVPDLVDPSQPNVGIPLHALVLYPADQTTLLRDLTDQALLVERFVKYVPWDMRKQSFYTEMPRNAPIELPQDPITLHVFPRMEEIHSYYGSCQDGLLAFNNFEGLSKPHSDCAKNLEFSADIYRVIQEIVDRDSPVGCLDYGQHDVQACRNDAETSGEAEICSMPIGMVAAQVYDLTKEHNLRTLYLMHTWEKPNSDIPIEIGGSFLFLDKLKRQARFAMVPENILKEIIEIVEVKTCQQVELFAANPTSPTAKAILPARMDKGMENFLLGLAGNRESA